MALFDRPPKPGKTPKEIPDRRPSLLSRPDDERRFAPQDSNGHLEPHFGDLDEQQEPLELPKAEGFIPNLKTLEKRLATLPLDELADNVLALKYGEMIE